jgi:hypothetical protein
MAVKVGTLAPEYPPATVALDADVRVDRCAGSFRGGGGADPEYSSTFNQLASDVLVRLGHAPLNLDGEAQR